MKIVESYGNGGYLICLSSAKNTPLCLFCWLFLPLPWLSPLYNHPLDYYGIASGNELILLCGIGIAAGLLGGLLGLGGGAIMLPVLDFWLGYSSPVAIGTTLFAVIFTVLSGAHGHMIRDNVDRKSSLKISIGGIIGILAGSAIFTMLLDQVAILNLCMGLFFLIPGYMMSRDGVKRQNESHLSGDQHSIAAKYGISDKHWLTGMGFLVGLITGTLGLGGGFLLVPGMTYGIGMSVHLAVGTTMLAAVPITIAGSLVKLLQGFVIIPAAIALATGTVIGAQIGAALIKYFQAWVLKLIFGISSMWHSSTLGHFYRVDYGDRSVGRDRSLIGTCPCLRTCPHKKQLDAIQLLSIVSIGGR